MSHIIQWISFERLMERWGLESLELDQVVKSGILTAFRSFPSEKNEYSEFDHGDNDAMDRYMLTKYGIFNIKDIERIENENPDFLQKHPSKMTAKESREYGQLKREKIKWDKSINAAVQATLFCINQESPVTRNQLWEKLSEKKLADIPNTTFEKIWKAIPQKYRSAGGRPSKA